MANKFADIPGLLYAWTTVESTMVPDNTIGTSKTQITSSEQGEGISPLTLVNSYTDELVLTANAVGAMPGLLAPLASDGGFYHLFEPTGIDVSADGYTLAIAFKHETATTTDMNVFGYDRRETQWTGGGLQTTPQNEYKLLTWGATSLLAENTYNTSTPQIRIFSTSPTQNSAKAYLNGVPDVNNPLASNVIPAGDDGTFKSLMVGNSRTLGSTNAMHAAWCIFAFYNRQLTDAEASELNDLMQVYLDTGAPPSTVGPSTTFGPVSTNDDPSVTGWQWEESADGNSWANVGTILTDTSGATTTTLTVNSAPIEADQAQVRCRATSAKEPAGVVSHTATLTVQP